MQQQPVHSVLWHAKYSASKCKYKPIVSGNNPVFCNVLYSNNSIQQSTNWFTINYVLVNQEQLSHLL